MNLQVQFRRKLAHWPHLIIFFLVSNYFLFYNYTLKQGRYVPCILLFYRVVSYSWQWTQRIYPKWARFSNISGGSWFRYVYFENKSNLISISKCLLKYLVLLLATKLGGNSLTSTVPSELAQLVDLSEISLGRWLSNIIPLSFIVIQYAFQTLTYCFLSHWFFF